MGLGHRVSTCMDYGFQHSGFLCAFFQSNSAWAGKFPKASTKTNQPMPFTTDQIKYLTPAVKIG